VLAGRGWGGAERLACAVARGIEDAGAAVAIETTPDCAAHARMECPGWLDDGADRFARDDARGAVAVFQWANAARRRVLAFRPDVVHLHLSTPAFAGAAARIAAGVPSLWTFHLLPERSWPLDYMLRVPCAWPLHLVAKSARATFVAVSQTDASALRERFGAAAVRCIVNAPPPPSGAETLTDRAAWGSAKHALLFVGRLEKQKGLDRLLYALASPPLTAEAFGLLALGDGPERVGLERLAAQLDLGQRVVFAGSMPAGSAMRAADIVVCPSRVEGMPLVPMEAVLSGTAVIASPIAPHRELLGSVPESLLPTREDAWPSAIAGLLSRADRLTSLMEDQRPLAARFSFARVIDEYQALYEQAAGRRHLQRASHG
jgi:glycosyltransferase involved in cell wall biosynthesis